MVLAGRRGEAFGPSGLTGEIIFLASLPFLRMVFGEIFCSHGGTFGQDGN